MFCGSNYTLGLDMHGDLFSWGWNESGVLGHGLHHYSSEPQKVAGIGSHAGRRCGGVCSGPLSESL